MEKLNFIILLRKILHAGISLILISSIILEFNSCVRAPNPLEQIKASRNIVDGLVRGMIGYKIPDNMRVGEDNSATISITKALNDSILYKGLDKTGYTSEEIKISSRVKATLKDPTGNKDQTPSGKNFEINALSTEEQLVDKVSNTIWKWNIRPKRRGNNFLLVSVTVKILNDLGDNYRDISVFEKTINVKASAIFSIKQFVNDYWQWILSVCVIPLLAFGYKKFFGGK